MAAPRRRKRSRPRAAGDVLATGQRALSEKIRAAAGLSDAWERAVGAELAEHVFPLRVQGWTLELGVHDPVWIQELALMAPQILAAVAKELPGIHVNKLRYRHVERDAPAGAAGGATPPAADNPTGPRPGQTPSPPPPEIPAAAIAGIEDPDLRAAFQRLAELAKG